MNKHWLLSHSDGVCDGMCVVVCDGEGYDCVGDSVCDDGVGDDVHNGVCVCVVYDGVCDGVCCV